MSEFKVKSQDAFKVGDKVEVRDLSKFDREEHYSIVSNMMSMSGKTFTIKSVEDDGELIKLDTEITFNWHPSWLKPASVKEESEWKNGDLLVCINLDSLPSMNKEMLKLGKIYTVQSLIQSTINGEKNKVKLKEHLDNSFTPLIKRFRKATKEEITMHNNACKEISFGDHTHGVSYDISPWDIPAKEVPFKVTHRFEAQIKTNNRAMIALDNCADTNCKQCGKFTMNRVHSYQELCHSCIADRISATLKNTSLCKAYNGISKVESTMKIQSWGNKA